MAISDNGSCPVCDVFGLLHLGRICCTNNGLENELCTRNPAVNTEISELTKFIENFFLKVREHIKHNNKHVFLIVHHIFRRF